MQSQFPGSSASPISLLLVDDSLVFRRFIRDLIDDCDDITIAGEAQNGIEALDLVLKTNPDVILLDVEMPLMDGMTALQHLMIHRPTPTIMLSSLTEEGTARSFDTLKNGAVDFICKNFIFQENKLLVHKKFITDKVKKAAGMEVKSVSPVFTASGSFTLPAKEEQRVVFCEECGNKEVVSFNRSRMDENIICSVCGDSIDLVVTGQYRRNTFVTVIGGGEGGFYNLLNIIPRLEPDMGGAVIAVLHCDVKQIDSFTEYLDSISSMKVLRAGDGVSLEAGNCYLASGEDYMCLKPYSTRLTLQRLQKKTADNVGPLDVLMASVSAIFKKKAAGIIISGDKEEGEKGISILMRNRGTQLILESTACLCSSMGKRVMKQCNIHTTVSMDNLVEKIKHLHRNAKDDIVTG
ncbi:chemotaxis protein CheB [Desulfomarina sp.]